MKKLALIGTGNMGSALARAACRSVAPEQVLLYNRTGEKARALAKETGAVWAETAEEAVLAADYVMLCMKPQGFDAAVAELVPALEKAKAAGRDQVVVSIAAGVSIERVERLLEKGGVPLPVIRVMPNTPAAVGQGVLLTAPGADVTQEAYDGFAAFMADGGTVERVTEQGLEMGTALSGCGPAFVYLFIEALADGGVEIGLPRAQAQRYAAQTVLGAAEMVLKTGVHPGALKDAVCSPGGSTIAGVAELEKRAFRAAAAQAVAASWKKTCDMRK